MDEFSWVGAGFAAFIVCFATFMIFNMGKNVTDEIC